MTAPASLPALIAEGRRLIAQATPGPWDLPHLGDPSIACNCGTIFAGPEEIVVATVHEQARNAQAPPCGVAAGNAALIVLAVNALPALLDAIEAAEKVHDAMEAYREAGGYHSYRALLDAHAALDSALSRLRGVRS